MTTRRDLLIRSVAVAAVAAIPAPTSSESVAQAATSERTGATTYTFIGVIYVGEHHALTEGYIRALTFTVNHHEDWKDDTVDVLVEAHGQPQDTFDFTVLPRQGFPGILAEIHDYISEQERCRYADGGPLAARTLSGVTSVQDDDAQTATASVEELTASDHAVVHRIGPLGDSSSSQVVTSHHVEVVRYVNQVIDARKAHERKLAPARTGGAQ